MADGDERTAVKKVSLFPRFALVDCPPQRLDRRPLPNQPPLIANEIAERELLRLLGQSIRRLVRVLWMVLGRSVETSPCQSIDGSRHTQHTYYGCCG